MEFTTLYTTVNRDWVSNLIHPGTIFTKISNLNKQIREFGLNSNEYQGSLSE